VAAPELSGGALSVPAAARGERLDRFLAAQLGLPRHQVQQWIRARRVDLDGRSAKASSPLRGGERLEWRPPPRPASTLVPEPEELVVLHEDPDLAVLDKPAGVTVHPGAGRATGTLAHRLLARYPETAAVGGPGRPGIVHRLDKGTSGALVVARTPLAYRELSSAFAERRVEKRYLAVVYGRPRAPSGRLESPIGRHPQRRREMTVRRDGRPARTDYRLLRSAAGLSLLELGLATGRTHQIRVHLKSLGLPLVGDPVYGEARWRGFPRPLQGRLRDFPRPALHAWRLAFAHPADGRRLEVEAPVPEDLEALWRETTGTPFPALA
jgi:23S rRNA pseudouridine1911/1915/1917 synthase